MVSRITQLKQRGLKRETCKICKNKLWHEEAGNISYDGVICYECYMQMKTSKIFWKIQEEEIPQLLIKVYHRGWANIPEIELFIEDVKKQLESERE